MGAFGGLEWRDGSHLEEEVGPPLTRFTVDSGVSVDTGRFTFGRMNNAVTLRRHCRDPTGRLQKI